MVCTGEQITNESCSFYCDPGFQIHNSITRTCQADHTWTGDEPYCTIKSCEMLKRPLNAYIVSDPCFTEFTSKCEIGCVEGYYVKDKDFVEEVYQECRAEPDSNAMYWSDPPECICEFSVWDLDLFTNWFTYLFYCPDKPPCSSNPCLNNGVCRDINNFEYRCNCKGTHYKGLQCDIGIIEIPQIPILIVGQRVTVNIEAHPSNELHLIIYNGDKGIDFFPTSLIFDPQDSSAILSITAKTHGIHYLYFNITGEDSQSFESPHSMMVVVQQNDTLSTHTHFQYFDQHNQRFGILKPGCCEKHESHLFCLQNDIAPTFLSSCSWGNLEETSGVVFTQNNDLLLPMAVAGAQVHSQHPLLTLPILPTKCGTCGSKCGFYNITEEDVIDFIKSHALARSFLNSLKELLPSFIRLNISAIDSWQDATFFSYDIVLEVAFGDDIVLIDECESLNVLDDGLYAVLRYNDSLSFSYNGIEYNYLPRYDDSPICFAVSLCDGKGSPVYITIPEGHQEDIEQIDDFRVS